MAKKNVSEIERGAGFFMGLATGLMDVVREREVPFEAIYRLVTPAGRKTVEKMVEVALGDWQEEQPRPTEPKGSTYCIPVTYKLLPMAELREKYDGCVSDLFDGRSWERHSSCKDIDLAPSERFMRLAEIPEQFFTENKGTMTKPIREIQDQLAVHFDKLGERFAIETEAHDFACKEPDAQRKNWILALGSSALHADGDRYVAVLDEGGRGHVLLGYWVDYGLDRCVRLLLVRK